MHRRIFLTTVLAPLTLKRKLFGKRVQTIPVTSTIPTVASSMKERLYVWYDFSFYTKEDFKRCSAIMITNRGEISAPPISNVDIVDNERLWQVWLYFDKFDVTTDLAKVSSPDRKEEDYFIMSAIQLLDKNGHPRLPPAPAHLKSLANDYITFSYELRCGDLL